MTSPLIYLSLSRLKNAIRDLFRKPARLIYVVFLVALFVLAVGGSQSGPPPEAYRDPREMVAMATALFLFIFLISPCPVNVLSGNLIFFGNAFFFSYLPAI